jgi:hypothetical protein
MLVPNNPWVENARARGTANAISFDQDLAGEPFDPTSSTWS